MMSPAGHGTPRNLGRQGLHDLPLVGQKAEDFANTLEMPHHLRNGGLFDSIVVHQVPCLFEFAQHKFEPQFERLVDDDEMELVAEGGGA